MTKSLKNQVRVARANFSKRFAAVYAAGDPTSNMPFDERLRLAPEKIANDFAAARAALSEAENEAVASGQARFGQFRQLLWNK